MNVALFIHPADVYVHAALGLRKETFYDFLALAIDQRFRAKSWHVVWLVPCSPDRPNLPDIASLSTNLPVLDDDIVIPSSLTLEDLVNGKQMAPERAFRAVDELGIGNLAVCGFRNKLVEAFASTAYVCGLDDVLVHEDLTERTLNEAFLAAPDPSTPTVPFLREMSRNPHNADLQARYAKEHAYRLDRPFRMAIPPLDDFLATLHPLAS